MKHLFLFLLAMATIFLNTCNETNVNTETGPVAGENYVIHENSALAEETAQNRSTEISDAFEINDVRVETSNGKKLMHVDVTQQEGCKESYPKKFEVVWDGIMLMIYPPQIGFYLKFNADGCPKLMEDVEETITLDLYDIFEDKNVVDEARFTIMNASKPTPENDYQVDG